MVFFQPGFKCLGALEQGRGVGRRVDGYARSMRQGSDVGGRGLGPLHLISFVLLVRHRGHGVARQSRTRAPA